MCSKNGTRIQEELGDIIKIYTSQEWAAELARREAEEKANAEKKEAKEAKAEAKLEAKTEEKLAGIKKVETKADEVKSKATKGVKAKVKK